MVSSFKDSLSDRSFRQDILLFIVTACFLFINAVGLSLANTGSLQWKHLWAPLVWVFTIGSAYCLLAIFRPNRDRLLLPIYGILSGWGILLIDRLAANFLARQAAWLVIGTAVMLIVAILPRNLRLLRTYRYTLLVAGLLMLAITLIVGVNPSGYGLTLWLPFPLPFFVPFYFQPSELLKLLIVIYLASYFADRELILRHSQRQGIRGALPYLAPMLLMWGFCMILLVWQRDLGAATIFFIVFLAMLYVVTNDRKYVILGLLLLLIAGIIAYYLFDVVALRVDAWWNPWAEALGRSFQIVQSLYAIAAGGVGGQGIGQGFPTYIPVVHSDFVFAAISEEWGLTGSLGIVICFLILAFRGFRIAMLNNRPFRVYLATGITVLISTQVLLIMGGVSKILPLTGVTLPFVSYGGSSMLISCIMMGLLLYISSDRK